MPGMSGQDHLAPKVWKSMKILWLHFSVASRRVYRWRIFVKNLWHCIQVTCKVSCPFGIHLRSLQRWPTSHIAEHVDQSSHGPKWCWQITGQGTWYGKEDPTKNIKGRLWVNAQKHVLRNKNKQQFCLFWRICWFRFGSSKLPLHCDDHTLLHIASQLWHQVLLEILSVLNPKKLPKIRFQRIKRYSPWTWHRLHQRRASFTQKSRCMCDLTLPTTDARKHKWQ